MISFAETKPELAKRTNNFQRLIRIDKVFVEMMMMMMITDNRLKAENGPFLCDIIYSHIIIAETHATQKISQPKVQLHCALALPRS